MGKPKNIRSIFVFIAKTLNICFGICLLISLATPYINPIHIPILPFFGLGFPILFVLNILFMLLWLFQKSRWFWGSLIILIVSIPFQMKIFSLNLISIDKAIGAKSDFKIMSYNVRLFDLYNPSFKEALASRNSIFQFLRNEDPDILCLQEYYEQKEPSTFHTKDSIQAILNSTHFFKKGFYIPHGKQTFGLACFSKFPILNQGCVTHQGSQGNNKNFCIYIDIVKNKDTVRVYNVHLQSIKLETKFYVKNISEGNKDETTKGIKRGFSKLKKAFAIRAKQSAAVNEHILTSPFPTIVCGDFNDTPISYTYHKFEDNLIDAFRNTSTGFGSTYIGFLPAGRIDYIFHSETLNSSGFKIQTQELSDHRAISCTIY